MARFINALNLNAPRVNGFVDQTDQASCGHVKGMHCTAFNDLAHLVSGHVKSPHMLSPLVFCFAKQGAAILTPHQWRLGFAIPFVAECFPGKFARGSLRVGGSRQAQACQSIGLCVADLLVRCQEGQLCAICTVDRRREIPSTVIQQIANALNFSAAQFNLRQGHARCRILTAIGIVHKADAFAIGCNGKVMGTRLAALQLKISAFQQIVNTTCGHLHDTQVRHTVHGQVVIPMSVDRIFGGKRRVFDRLHFFEFVGLCFYAL